MGIPHQKSAGRFLVPILAAAVFSCCLPNLRAESLEAGSQPSRVKRDFAKLKAALLSSVHKLGASADAGIKKQLNGTGPARIVLDATLEPQSGDVIDCRGGSILPRKLAAANRGLSVPDTLIFIDEGVEGVQILNCTLDATFPIVIAGGGNHRISGNNIRSSSQAIHTFGGDNIKIDHNWIRSTGTHIQINGDSDHTEIFRNHIDFQPGGAVVDGTPGLGVEFGANPGVIGVGIFSYPGVAYLVINDRLVQILTFGDTHPDNTVVRENAIDLRHSFDFTIGVGFAARSRYSLAERNNLIGGPLGVLGNPDDLTYFEPGVCSEEPELACSPDEGVCEFLGLGVCIDWNLITGGGRVIAPVMVDNRVSGSEAGLAGGLSDDQLRWERNHLENNDVGILLFSYALASSTIRGNTLSRNDVGLRIELDNDTVECPALTGLDISYNDFGGSDQPFEAATLVSDPEDEELVYRFPYLLPTTLPNNWWGSDPCGFPENEEQWPNVVGPNAATMPIAAAWQAGEADLVPRCDVDVEPVECAGE